MATPDDTVALERPDKNQLARIVFFVFLLTFLLARIVVFLIMSRRIPDLYRDLLDSACRVVQVRPPRHRAEAVSD